MGTELLCLHVRRERGWRGWEGEGGGGGRERGGGGGRERGSVRREVEWGWNCSAYM